MWLWIKITEKILTRWLINEFLAANSSSMRPNGVCLSVHPSVQAQNMFLRDGEKCSSSTVGLFSQMLFEWSQRHWKPRPRKQGYDNAGRVLVEVPGWGGRGAAHCALWESDPGPGQLPHMGPGHTCFTPCGGWRGAGSWSGWGSPHHGPDLIFMTWLRSAGGRVGGCRPPDVRRQDPTLERCLAAPRLTPLQGLGTTTATADMWPHTAAGRG